MPSNNSGYTQKIRVINIAILNITSATTIRIKYKTV